MNPLSDPEDLHEATQTINQYAQSDWCRIYFSQHARSRMAEREVPNDVILQVLRTGFVVEVRQELRNGRLTYKYKVQLVDAYGRVTVITAIPGFHQLTVVTTYSNP